MKELIGIMISIGGASAFNSLPLPSTRRCISGSPSTSTPVLSRVSSLNDYGHKSSRGSSWRPSPHRRNNNKGHSRIIQHALPSPLELSQLLDGASSSLHASSYLNSVSDFVHSTTTTTISATATTNHLHEHLSSWLLSDSSSTSHNIGRMVHEVIDEVENEIRNEITENNNHLDSITVTPEMEKASLNNVGHDLIIFLTICAVAAPLSAALNISPVLLYLAFGLVAGPHGMGLLRGNEEVGFELGDFGILFLLFVEGLNLSPERLRELGSFFSLGATQLLLSAGVIFFGFFLGGPLLFQVVSNPNVPIDPLIVQLLEQPVVAFAIAAAGSLSSSAFVLPILKEKGWEDRPDGIAALSILLLQDLAVAPLLVILPLIANVETGATTGSGGADPIALGILAFKATVGFGAVLALASVALRKVFQIVASSRSSQSFVAASLLVAVGMGVVSDFLGLSSTTGAFAAGVLLAESGYRAQIEVS
jgi:Kef-type K+ transport system membrane component KefB